MERYKVIKDLQGGNFGMFRDYTIEQWRKQAIDWCWMDDDENLAKAIYEMDEEILLDFISEIWAIEFRKVRKDKKNFEDIYRGDFEKETLKEFYEKRFN